MRLMMHHQRDDKHDLPSGMVTFVFTDIEASSRLLRQLDGDDAVYVFERHDELLRQSWSAHGGVEVNTEGDSFFVAFRSAADAVAACVDAQSRLAAEPWPSDVVVRVRMGAHCGLAAPRRDNYVSLAVHQAARVMAAAHGGQILISPAVADLVSPTHAFAISSIGHYRVRDFDDACELYRVDAAGLVPNDRPIRATPAMRHNLVPVATSFVGRETDLVAINGLLGSGQLVTLVGPGGVGKTRLANEVGSVVADAWPDGVWMVELADVLDGELICEAVVRALGASSSAHGAKHDLHAHLRDAQALLILDNAEHQLDATARLVQDLMAQCPNVAILVTSRETLGLGGEQPFRVQPLTAPDQVRFAIELFIDRARSAAPELSLRPTDEPTIAAICERLDGLPLAIEIAAARVRVMQLDEILSGLDNRFRLLRSRDRTLPERQRTMEGLLSWSYRLLDTREQAAFRRLAVFGSDFCTDAAIAAVANEVPPDEVPELVWALSEKSLVMIDLSQSSTRYRLPESVQQYAMRLLLDNDDVLHHARAVAEWYLDMVAPWHVADREWLGNLDVELPNLRSLVDLIAADAPELAQQIMCTIGRYHDVVHTFDTGVEELTRAVHELQAATPSRVALLTQLADLHLRRADVDAASRLLDEASELANVVGVPTWSQVAIERTAGEIALRLRDYGRAADIAQKALASADERGASARVWNLLGLVRYEQGAWSEALDAFEQELAGYSALSNDARVTSAQSNVAEAALRMGDHARAARYQLASLDGAVALGQPVLVAYSLIVAARLAGASHDWISAVELQAAAQAILHDAAHALYDADRRELESLVADAAQILDAAELTTTSERGAKMALPEAVAVAASVLDRTTQHESQLACATARDSQGGAAATASNAHSNEVSNART